MASILNNLSFLNKISQDLIKARKINYSQQSLSYYIDQNNFVIHDLPDLYNNYNHILKATLVQHKGPSYTILNQFIKQDYQTQHIIQNQKCIIFLHGLGSSRLQGLPLVQQLPQNYCLCVFDMSGSGKSQGQHVSYGVRQQQDIQSIINYLKHNRNIKEFVLWGRSMGAVAVLLYAINISKSQKQSDCQTLKSIKCLVVDSPFYDFSEITKHIAIQKMAVPSFIVDVGIHLINDSFEKLLYDEQKKISYNPFQIKFDKEIKSKIPAVFLCSEKDEVVPISHCQKIMKNYKFDFEKIIMENISHNQQRPHKVIQQVFSLISKCSQRVKRKRKNILDLDASKDHDIHLYKSLMQKRKGIAVITPSRQKSRFKQQINVDISTSSIKDRFLDNLDLNGSQNLHRNNSFQSVGKQKSQLKKKTIDLTFCMRKSPLKTQKLFASSKRNTHVSNINQQLYNQTFNIQAHFNSVKIQRCRRQNTGNNSNLLRNKRYNNFMRKIEPKLTHSRYL